MRSVDRRPGALSWLGSSSSSARRLRIASTRSGLAAATGLAAQWMARAGLRQRALTGDRVSLEQLLVAPPQVLLRSDYRSGQYSSAQRWLSHPLAARAKSARTIATDGRLWTCMG